MLPVLEKLETRKQIENDMVEMRNAGVSDAVLKTLGAGASNPGAEVLQDLKVIHHLWEKHGT